MEKANGGGISRLPIGYRFYPTDEELIVHYLRRKIFGAPLPASVIPELDVFQYDPWSLPGDLKEKRYFFGRKLANHDGESRSKIAAGSGYWKPNGKTRPILTSLNHIVGLRKTLIFCQGKPSHASKTQWVMQEYHLLGSGTIPHKIQISKSKLGEWVVYRLFQRRRRPRKQEKIINSKSLNTSEVMIHSKIMRCRVEESSDAAGFLQSSSPCSSGITEVHSTGLDQEEEITSFHS